jgi:hypothetical protein
MYILLTSGSIGSNSRRNGRSYDAGYSSFTINIRTSSTSTIFDNRVFTIRTNGVMILCTFLCGAAAATDAVFIVYSSASTGYANNLIILNNGDTTIRTNLLVNGKLSIGSTSGTYPLQVSPGTSGEFTSSSC